MVELVLLAVEVPVAEVDVVVAVFVVTSNFTSAHLLSNRAFCHISIGQHQFIRTALGLRELQGPFAVQDSVCDRVVDDVLEEEVELVTVTDVCVP